MGRPGFPFDLYRSARAILVAAFLFVMVVTCTVLPVLFETLPHASQEVIAERFLWTLLILYWFSLVPAVFGGAMLTFVMIRARRNHVKRPTAARLLLLRVHGALPGDRRGRQ